jgi:thiol-disulfide isomerase/thioredoxin
MINKPVSLFSHSFLVGTLVALLWGGALSVSPLQAAPSFHTFQAGDTSLALPDTPFTDLQGKPKTLAELKGSLVLLVFWATWCPSCVNEAQDLDKLAAHFSGKKFKLIALSHDRSTAPVEAFYNLKDIKNTPIYFDNEMKIARSLEIRGVPTAFLISPQGKIIGRLEGSAPWNSKEAHSLIQFYLPS